MTIWHQRQFGTADNLAPQTIWHRTNCPHLACGAKLSAVPNCPLYTTVPNFPGAKLSTFSLQCQLVRQHGRCQIVQYAKLSAVPNCPRTPQSVHLLEGGGTLFGQITFKYLKSYTWVFPKASSRNSLGLFSSQIIGHSLFILLN